MTALREIRNQTQPRRGLRRNDAAIYVGISPTKFDELVKAGRLPKPKRIDNVVVWDKFKLDDAFESLPGDEQEAENPWD
ncbi:MAG: helix-turn-helix transcriptional regulator [Reyranella sp.]